jgi:hypothetical protein
MVEKNLKKIIVLDPQDRLPIGDKAIRNVLKCSFVFIGLLVLTSYQAPKKHRIQWRIVNTRILMAGDEEDRAALRKCINKRIVDWGDSIFIDSKCLFDIKIKGYSSGDCVLSFAEFDSLYDYSRLNSYLLNYGSVDKIQYRKIHFINALKENDSFSLFRMKKDKMLLYYEPYILVMTK